MKNPDYTKHDKEFTQYFWSLGRYNKVREGDKFIYRKPSKVSDNKQFYFFGSGTVGEIKKIGKDDRGSDNVICKIINQENIFLLSILLVKTAMYLDNKI